MGDPFVRLQTSSMWTVMQQEGSAIGQEETSPRHLRAVGAVGMLTPLFRSALTADPRLKQDLVDELLVLVQAPAPQELRSVLALHR